MNPQITVEGILVYFVKLNQSWNNDDQIYENGVKMQAQKGTSRNLFELR
jgi:hypothetical protein